MLSLSVKEIEVLQYVVIGMDNNEIANKLFITTDTVKAHISSIMRKFNVKNRTAAAYQAIKNGIIEI